MFIPLLFSGLILADLEPRTESISSLKYSYTEAQKKFGIGKCSATRCGPYQCFIQGATGSTVLIVVFNRSVFAISDETHGIRFFDAGWDGILDAITLVAANQAETNINVLSLTGDEQVAYQKQFDLAVSLIAQTRCQ